MTALAVAAALAAAAGWLWLVRHAWRHPRALDGLAVNCRWCSARPYPSARHLAAIPSDCTCTKPCPALGCGAKPVRRHRHA